MIRPVRRIGSGVAAYFLQVWVNAVDLVIPTISQGLLWSILAIGVFLTYRVLDIADLTVEGSFPLGAAVAAAMLTAGYNPFTAIAVAAVAGMLAGVVTGILTTKLKIPALLAGILTMIALYSVNLRIMGKANLSLLRVDTIFSLASFISDDRNLVAMTVGLIAVILVIVGNYWFFGTEIGAAIRATGNNPNMIRANGIDTDATVILGLLLSNGLVAVSGALIGQDNGFADVGMGTGTIVIGLASVIIGEVLFFHTRDFFSWLVAVVLGSIVYRVVIALVLQMGMPPNDLKLFTAALVAIALAMPLVKKKLKAKREVA